MLHFTFQPVKLELVNEEAAKTGKKNECGYCKWRIYADIIKLFKSLFLFVSEFLHI